MNDNRIKLTPYLHFAGNCEEALNTYKEIFGGTVEIHDRYDNPEMKAPDNYKDKVLHGRFYFDENIIMASDVFPGQDTREGTGDAALSITLNDLERAKLIFNELAEGGETGVPFEKQFWGAWHGNLTDRFGVRWMISVE